MLRAIKIATLAAVVQIVEGHVRALPTGADGFGCRDCNGKASPGPFRVNGPLGNPGKQFGANGVATVTEGEEVTLKIGYNGGHKSATLNYFNVRYACGADAANANNFKKAGTSNKDQINCNAPCTQLTAAQITKVDGAAATPANYPIDATNSNQGGYTVSFQMPTIQGTGNARQCTFAMVEGRDWGAGWDFQVQPKNTGGGGAGGGGGGGGGANPAPAPPPTPAPAAKSVQGTYRFTPDTCQNDAPGCKCLTGEIVVAHTAGQNQALATVNIQGYPAQTIPLEQKNIGAWSRDYVLAACGVGDQELDLTLAPDAQSTTASILNVGVIAQIPTVCGHIIKTSLQPAAPVQPQALQQCPQCQNLPFQDKDGDGCAAFKSCNNVAWRIKPLQHYQKYPDVGSGKTARDQCCGCGGGTTKVAPIAPTTTPKPTTIPPQQPGVPAPAPVIGGPVIGLPPGSNPNLGGGTTTTARPGGMFGGGAFVSSAPAMDLTFGVVLTVFAGLFM